MNNAQAEENIYQATLISYLINHIPYLHPELSAVQLHMTECVQRQEPKKLLRENALIPHLSREI